MTVDSAVSSLEKEVDDSMLASLSLNNTSVKKQARKSVHDTSTVHVAKQRSALEDKADSTQEKGNLHNCDIRCDGNQETQDPDEHRPERASPLKLSQLSIAFDKLFNDGENKMEVVQEPTVGTPIENRISCPYKTRQELHVTYNNECARYEGLPPAWRALNVQFGLPLEAVPKRDVEGYEAKIPAVLQMMKEYLLSRGGVYSEGIFRLAPDRDECAAVKRAINDGTFTGCTDINVIANLIKVLSVLTTHVLSCSSDIQLACCDTRFGFENCPRVCSAWFLTSTSTRCATSRLVLNSVADRLVMFAYPLRAE